MISDLLTSYVITEAQNILDVQIRSKSCGVLNLVDWMRIIIFSQQPMVWAKLSGGQAWVAQMSVDWIKVIGSPASRGLRLGQA